MPGKIGIIGSGLIGRSWSMIFASQAYDVYLYDVVPDAVDKALVLLKDQFETFEKSGTLRGDLSAAEQFAHIHKATKLEDAVSDAVHIQECVFENLKLKQKVFLEVDGLPCTSKEVVLCSSTSCFLPSLIAEKIVRHRAQFIVGHPINPPYFVPLVEIVPSPWTEPAVLERTRQLLTTVGQKPVVLKREIEGFIVNRVQYAILNECYRLVESGIISHVTDVDTVMSEGLGMRYAFMGPWQTAHLNAAGIGDYFAKYSKGIYDVSTTMGPTPKMEGATAKLIADELTKAIPIEKLEERRKWRDQHMIALSQLKKKMK